MKSFAKFNDWFLQKSGGDLGMKGDIYIGTKKFNDIGPGYTIKSPGSATDLSSVDQRIDIAHNGFNQLNMLRQDPAASRWVDFPQNRLGSAQGIYRPIGFKWSRI